MAFNWKALAERLDPRKLNWGWVAPARDWVVANKTTVLSTSIALLIGLWGGAVLGRVSTGAPAFDFAQLGSIGAGETARNANAPRAGLPAVEGMAFVRLRTEMNAAEPRACLEFSQNLSTDASINYADYIVMDPAVPYQTDVSGNLLCLGGLPFEPERQITIREGLPSASGERTEFDETFMLTFGDRPAYVGFAGGGVILPRSEADGIAIETVNVSRIGVEVLRVPDRILSQYTVDPGEINEEGGWGYWGFNSAGEDVGVQVYEGEIDVDTSVRNSAVTTVFALGAALNELRPGAYVVKVRDASPSAGQRGESENESVASAYRWILYTDMALQSFSGATGLDVVVRSLRTARPMGNITVTLIAQNNEELARTRTDADGRVHFADALVNGDGPARARYVMAYGAEGDFAALDLQRPGLDLSDRGVDGRYAPGDVDAYLYTERGIYRPGERVRLMGLIRDQVGRAISNRQSTLVVYRPNGTEWRRIRMTEAEAAGAVAKNIDLDRGAPRGVWRASLLVDGQEQAAGEVSWSVEDFVPQRLRVQIEANEQVLRRGQSRPINVQADFLYGAPGSGLPVEAEGRLMVDPTPFPDFDEYSFGRSDESFDERMFQLPGTVTDGQGAAQLSLQLPDEPETTLPLRARVIASVADPGGRLVRESFTVPVRLSNLYLGLAPQFENRRAGAGERVAYDVIALNADGRRVAARGVQWQLVREDWSYDWYLDNGAWRWRRTGRDIPVDGATVDVPANQPLRIAKDGLRSGSYRLIVRVNGAESSARFGVGWGGPADDDATPDMVSVVPPENPTRPGARARVQIRPPYAGEAQIVVATDRVIESRTVRVSSEGTTIDLPVSTEWGSGAYVLVTVMTPRDPVNLPVPRRAIGVAYVPVDMGNRTLEVSAGEGLQNVRPRTTVNIPIQVRNAPAGERVRVAIAMVDEGILNITKYESPNPVDYFFGRRALGVEIRDDYGRLLNPNLGAPATPRQGGDSLGGEGLTVVPTRTVSLFSDIVEVRGGRATIPLTIPDFNGTLRLMAVAWSESAVGQDAEQIIVRDPVVAELILPRFLAPGDQAQGTLNIDNVEGPNGAYTVTIGGNTAARIAQQPRRFQLNRGQRQTALIPISGGPLGVGEITLRLEGPQGFTQVERTYDIQSRAPFMPITITSTEPQATGVSWRAPADALASFQPSGSQALISFSNLAGLDPAPILDELYRYPYGCSEQLVSIAMPLLYYNTLAQEAERARDPRITRRLQETVTQLLDRQAPDGSFGLWHAGDGYASPWLGVYVTDFLWRARQQGYAVPRSSMQQAYNALRRIARLNDFGSVNYQFEVYRWPGSNDSTELLRSRSAAYALYVLAKAGEADIGQLRYFHDNRLRNEPSPLARAQIAAALAHMGDRARSRNAFRMAEQALGYRNVGDWYQTPLRDTAGVLALAAEAGETELVDRLRRRIERDAPDADQLMTQEQAQLLLAANALLQRAGPVNVSLNGEELRERRVIVNAQRLAAGLVFRNNARGTVWRTLQLSGVPREAPPAMQAGYTIDKTIFRMDGTVADLNSIRQGDRVVIVISGQPEGARNYPTVLVDLLPAGLEIETVLRPEDGAGGTSWDGTTRNGPFAWVGAISYANVAEARDDRFVASSDLRGSYRYAYIARAVSPGRYTMPAAQVEDMYRPGVMARTSTGSITIAPRGG
ncbi:MAG TPA: alpha-2-macroglobulin [Vitreimonas sp.]|uniref:alpha-2-macroglobulin family protein n=1 Tax=Vitreimonas sp. TaxID=3069702 RepID=UPI002D269729|nr:alpha-2-macroglobulin [Vitreimonas sp.]HYD89317.1 alpha-2-macroglobulin [Vitreimonas sp.]